MKPNECKINCKYIVAYVSKYYLYMNVISSIINEFGRSLILFILQFPKYLISNGDRVEHPHEVSLSELILELFLGAGRVVSKYSIDEPSVVKAIFTVLFI